MIKAKAPKRTKRVPTIKVKLGRLGESTREISVPVPDKATVETVLEKANISLNESESVWVEGVKASENDKIQKGDYLQIVGKKEGGR